MGKLKGSWLCAHLQSTVSPEFVCVAMHRVGICLAGTKYVMDFLVSAPSEGQCKKLASEEQQVSTETLCLGKNSALILPEDEHQSQGRNCIDKTLFETLPVQNYICSCYKEHKKLEGFLMEIPLSLLCTTLFLFRRQTESWRVLQSSVGHTKYHWSLPRLRCTLEKRYKELSSAVLLAFVSSVLLVTVGAAVVFFIMDVLSVRPTCIFMETWVWFSIQEWFTRQFCYHVLVLPSRSLTDIWSVVTLKTCSLQSV